MERVEIVKIMKKFYYQLKVKDEQGYWSYNGFFKGLVEAENSKKAREYIKSEILDKDIKKGDDVLLTVLEITEDKKYLLDFFTPRICKWCGHSYSYANNEYFGEFCCRACYEQFKEKDREINSEIYFSSDFNTSYPVIYRIYDKKHNKNYIGQTIRAFTLRWWEHYKAWINSLNDSEITDFEFSVLEVFPKGISKEDLTVKEQYYINKFDSLNNGYNSINAKSEESEEKCQK